MSDGTCKGLGPDWVARASNDGSFPSVDSSKEARVPQSSNPSANPDFSGLWIPLVTPFRGGAVDHTALSALTRRLADDGVAGFVVCASTGEAAALDETEQLAALDTVQAAAGGLPIIMGLSGYHLGKTTAWVRRLAERPLAGLQVPAPHYIRPSQAGLLEWFRAIADASAAPVLVYDIPYRTGATIARETLLTLAEHPRIRGIKDCGGDMAKTRAVIADGRLQVLSGEDHQIFSTVAEGGVGAIAASGHVQTRRFVQVLRLLAENRLAEARAEWQLLQPLIEMLFAEPNPGPLKALLAHSGSMMSDELRSPMTRAPDALRDRLVELNARLSRP
ncbi:4-hydroxy-tetrahydrodipicolinate synthase family protein [Variovorax paradoxus]|jgi:4-hydroxy-tetrahydrodipicolinate synthase|uniref:4-hydroxy-tetrahydrodipicolinate synthase family protein n=1 Tax=Variovorax paradoxus TaxID=34073 RepID=UPI00247FBEAA|nr:4-hydroxy-tetrahydrodipicolinate synthase [Variovorax paradoxus]WGT65064.1 4-hydroxy-tetrahydrodipicolinate synthase [Variovorax paradoxus]